MGVKNRKMINRVVHVNIAKIKELANAKGMSLTSLEDELGISHNTIRRWKKTGARANTLCIVADYFNTTIDSLLERV